MGTHSIPEHERCCITLVRERRRLWFGDWYDVVDTVRCSRRASCDGCCWQHQGVLEKQEAEFWRRGYRWKVTKLDGSGDFTLSIADADGNQIGEPCDIDRHVFCSHNKEQKVTRMAKAAVLGLSHLLHA